MLSTAIEPSVPSDPAANPARKPADSGTAPHPAELVVTVCSPEPRWRRSLSEFIDRCLEDELLAHGASARSSSVPRNLEDSLAHHLDRCSALGFGRIRLRLSSLGLIAEAGVLHATDSNTLRWWLDAQNRLPVSVDVSADVERLRVYLAPVSVATLLWARHGNRVTSAIGHSLSETPLMPSVFEREAPPDDPEPASSRRLGVKNKNPSESAATADLTPQFPEEPEAESDMQAVSDATSLGPASRESLPPTELAFEDLVLQPDDELDSVASTAAAFLEADTSSTSGSAHTAEDDERSVLADSLMPEHEAPADVETQTAPPARAREVEEQESMDSNPLFGALSAAGDQEEKAHLRVWRENLDTAHGVQSWDDLERLFLANYLPLLHAVEAGQASEAATHSVRRWALEFSECYSSAFAKLRSGGHRPTMVCDIPNVGFSLAREHDAPKTRLVLVDGMRFDLGQRAHDKLRLQLTGMAQCVARGVLWSALPATTGVQLELLARGPTALRNLSADLDESAWVAKGSAARRLRPMRVGGLNLTKLDILEAEFPDVSWSREALDRGAAEVAVSVGRYIKQQAPGTLVLVFSDHGSSGVDADVHSATPERVLVPYDAWLVGSDA